MATRKKTASTDPAAPKKRKTASSNSAAATAPALEQVSSSSMPTEQELHEQIRQRAYEIYTERGGHHGASHEDWFRAEREVMARYGR